MRASTKGWIIAASVLILTGLILFGGVMTVLKWDFTKLSTVKYETNRYDAIGAFKNISLLTDTSDVEFLPSENGEISVICHEMSKAKHSVTVKDETLIIELEDTRKWYDYIGINIGAPYITVYLPQEEYGALSVKGDTGDVKIPRDFSFKSIDVSVSTGDVECGASSPESIRIRTSTGDICVEGVSAKALDLSVSTGHVTVSRVKCEGDVRVHVSTGDAKLTDVRCKNFVSDGNTGDLSLIEVIGTGSFSVERSTGGVTFDGCDAAEIFVETDTGDVSGSLLTSKIFFVQTHTGRVDVPKTTDGGKCEIATNTGDVLIYVEE